MNHAITFFVFVCLLFSAAAWASQNEKTAHPYPTNVSLLEIRRGWSGGITHVVAAPDQLKQIMGEINVLRQKTWRPFIGKPGGCIMRIAFFAKDEKVLSLIVDAKGILEMPLTAEQRRLYLAMDAKDIPHLRALLFEVGLPERCRWVTPTPNI